MNKEVDWKPFCCMVHSAFVSGHDPINQHSGFNGHNKSAGRAAHLKLLHSLALLCPYAGHQGHKGGAGGTTPAS